MYMIEKTEYLAFLSSPAWGGRSVEARQRSRADWSNSHAVT
jgi:hypothetical protein